MQYVTRFNPTTNGDLHLGHLYIILFNEYVAHTSGGRFLVRFEDNSIDTLGSSSVFVLQPEQMANYCERQREAIEWLGIPVDEYSKQSNLDLEVRAFVARYTRFIPEYSFPFSIPLNPALGDYDPEAGEWFPYAPHLTFHRVIYDELGGVNVLIRGDDLRSEFSLYQHYRQSFGLPQLEHYYLPRLYGAKGQIVSKFHQARPILEYKAAGWSPDDIMAVLATSALKDPTAGWHLANVKQQPRLDEAFSKSVGVHYRPGSLRTYDFIRND